MWLLGFARFMFPNILIEPPTRFKVGFPDSLSPGQVETKFIAQFGVWIVRYEFERPADVLCDQVRVYASGCTPNGWKRSKNSNVPATAAVFIRTRLFRGPAPRPLERYAISLADDGQLLVDNSRTFQQELGQWKDPSVVRSGLVEDRRSKVTARKIATQH